LLAPGSDAGRCCGLPVYGQWLCGQSLQLSGQVTGRCLGLASAVAELEVTNNTATPNKSKSKSMLFASNHMHTWRRIVIAHLQVKHKIVIKNINK
jgi:hypothetical protein